MTSILNLIAEAGLDNVTVQPLDQCLMDFKATKRSGNRMTFVTEEGIQVDQLPLRWQTEKMGLVVWIPRELGRQAFEQPQLPGEPSEKVDRLRLLRSALKECIAAGDEVPALLCSSKLQEHLDALDVFFDGEDN